MRASTKGNSKISFSADKACAVVVIVSLLIGIFVLWRRVTELNLTVASLDEKLFQHTQAGGSAAPVVQVPVERQIVKSATEYAAPVPKKTMTELGMASHTDKVHEHGYDRFYPYFLEHLRDKEGLNMLEIGYNLGYSYQMWLNYFPKGNVYFMEKDHGVKFPQARFTGDQGSVSDLERLLVTKGIKGKLDFIIDDGSHHPEHQMVSFMHLFRYGLKPGGVYIIEDTETSYWRSGNTYGLSTEYGQHAPNSAINRLKGLIDVANRRYQPDDEPFVSTFGKEIDDSVQSIFFGPNSVVIIKMTQEEQARFASNTYLWKDKLKKPVK